MTPDTQQNVANLLRAVAENSPNKAALVFRRDGNEQSITFGELWQATGLFGAGLRSAGFQPGDRAIIMIPMSIDLYVTMLAIIKIGGVAVFVDPWIAAKQIARFAAFSDPTAYIGIGKSHFLRLFHQRLRNIRISVTNGKKFWRFPARFTVKEIQALAVKENDNTKSATSNDVAAVHPVRPDDSALITFTSGSSGEPKGANRTHGFLMSQHLALAREFPYEKTDIDMPMFPVFALNNLVTGLTSIVPEMDFRHVDKIDGNLITGQLALHGVTTVTASPPLIDRVAPHLENQARPIHLRRILTGGAPVTDAQLANWVKKFKGTELVVAYGSTEAEPVGHIVAQQRLELAGIGKGFCTGHPTSLVETRVIPIDKGPVDLKSKSLEDLTLPIGSVGELIVSGDHVCRDYYNNESATRENKIIDSTGKLWHRMGDTGYFDEHGRFWLVGRVHSTIYRNGEGIHPQLVEQVAANATGVSVQMAAISCPHDELGEQVVVIVALSSKDALENEDSTVDIERNIQAALDAAGLPCDAICVTNQPLPLDPRHRSKIDYAQTTQMFTDGEFS